MTLPVSLASPRKPVGQHAPKSLPAVSEGPSAKDLRTLVDSLDARNITIYRERTVHMSASDRFEKLNAAATTKWLLGQPAQFAAPLLISVNGGTLAPVRNLRGLEAVQCMHADGDPAHMEHPHLARVLHDATTKGVGFVARSDQSFGTQLEIPAFYAYEVLTRQEPLVSSVTWTDGRHSQALQTEDDALTYAFLEAGAPADGLLHPQVARDVASARDADVRFLSNHRLPSEMSAFEAFQALTRESGGNEVNLGVAGAPLVRVDAAHLGQGVAQVTPLLKAYHDILMPAGLNERTCEDVIERLARLPNSQQEQHAQLIADIFTSTQESDHYADYQLREVTVETYDWLQERLPTLDDPQQKVATMLGWVRRCGNEQAKAAADFAWRDLSDSHPQPADYKRVAGQFDELLGAFGKLEPARQALEVLQLPAGEASTDERMQVFRQLMPPAEPEPARVIGDYLAVAAACQKGDRLSQVADRLCTLRDALDLRGQGQAARASFEFIENGSRSGLLGDQPRDELLVRFLEEFVKSGSLEKARVRLLAPPQKAAGGSIDRQDDSVVIGGIRVPVKQGRTN